MKEQYPPELQELIDRLKAQGKKRRRFGLWLLRRKQ